MMKLPKGARILNATLKSADLGTTGILNVGITASADALESADADFFFAALDVKTAAINKSMTGIGTTIEGVHHKLLGDVTVVIVPTENTQAATGAKLSLSVEYVLE
jgi:hypothetical protein